MGTANHMLRKRGFTLVELMIVLAVIALLVVVSTVGALSMRVQSNEGLAKSSLKVIASACEAYRAVSTGYPADLSTLGTTYLSGGLEQGEKSGYTFVLKNGNSGQTFTCSAVPVAMSYSGVKSYCIDTSNVIYLYENSPNLTADGSACPSGGTALSN